MYILMIRGRRLSERWWRRRKRRHPWFGDKPYVFGFSVTLEPDVNPRFRRFGNPKPSCYGSEVQEEREPLVDVIEDDREVVIVAELPGVKKEDIQIHATQRNLIISVDTMERRYYKEVALPVETDPESAVATYKNGVLQVRLKKLVNAQLFTK